MQAVVDAWSFTPNFDKFQRVDNEVENEVQLFSKTIPLNHFLDVSKYLDMNFQFCKLTKLSKRSRDGMLQSGLRYMRGPLNVYFSNASECKNPSSIEKLYDFTSIFTLNLGDSAKTQQPLGFFAAPQSANQGTINRSNFDNFLQYSIFLIEFKRQDLKKSFTVNINVSGDFYSPLFAVSDLSSLQLTINDLAGNQVQFKNLLAYLSVAAIGINQICFKNTSLAQANTRQLF